MCFFEFGNPAFDAPLKITIVFIFCCFVLHFFALKIQNNSRTSFAKNKFIKRKVNSLVCPILCQIKLNSCQLTFVMTSSKCSTFLMHLHWLSTLGPSKINHSNMHHTTETRINSSKQRFPTGGWWPYFGSWVLLGRQILCYGSKIVNYESKIMFCGVTSYKTWERYILKTSLNLELSIITSYRPSKWFKT